MRVLKGFKPMITTRLDEKLFADNESLIRRVLASINVQQPEIDAMLKAYGDSMGSRYKEWMEKTNAQTT